MASRGPSRRERAGAGLGRRDVLRGAAGLGLLALTGCATGGTGTPLPDPELDALLETLIAVDIHSHAAGAGGRKEPTYDLASRMKKGGVTAVMLCHSGDGPVVRRGEDGRISTARQPGPGELWRFTQQRLEWFDALVKRQDLPRALKAGDLASAQGGKRPVIVQGIEGCQFLEGKLERIAEVHGRGVRHLQLVHYFRSDMGDNQTERADQGGLTGFGREAVQEANRLRLVVDVAHGTQEMVEATAKVCKTPLILSHTAVGKGKVGPFSRRITTAHAKAVADTGGVVGIWCSPTTFKTLEQFAEGIAIAVDAIGADHVGIGSDNSGFGQTQTVWDDYADFLGVVRALRKHGFRTEELRKILGGNYVRVFDRSLPA